MPNLAVMRLATYWRRQGAEVSFPYDGRGADKLYASVIFSRNRDRALQLVEKGAEIGGTGWDPHKALPPEVEACPPDYSLYPDVDYAIGFTSRGCIRRCPFCVVPKKEGPIQSVATIPDLVRPGSNFLVLLDNNFLANTERDARLAEIEKLDLTVNFTQGLDIRLVDAEVAERLARIKTSNLRRTKRTIYFAFDDPSLEPTVRRGVTHLVAAGIAPSRLMFYVLVGYNTSFEEDMHRFRVLRDLGVDPYVMLYNDHGPPTLRHFERWVNARVYKVCAWDEYLPWQRLRANDRQMALWSDRRGIAPQSAFQPLSPGTCDGCP